MDWVRLGFGLAAEEGVGVLFAEAGEVHGAPFRGQGALFGAHALESIVVIVGVSPVEMGAGSRVFGGISTRTRAPEITLIWGAVREAPSPPVRRLRHNNQLSRIPP